MQVYELLDSLRYLLPAAQSAGRTRGLVLLTTSLRPTQTVALGGFLFEATLSRSWPARTIIADDGAMLILQASPGEFYVVGSGLTVSFARDPDVDTGIAGIESVEQVSRVSGQRLTARRLNGDQTNQGRQLLMDSHQRQIYRVRLYTPSIRKQKIEPAILATADEMRDSGGAEENHRPMYRRPGVLRRLTVMTRFHLEFDSCQLSLTFIPRRVRATMCLAAELVPSSKQRKPEPESARESLT